MLLIGLIVACGREALIDPPLRDDVAVPGPTSALVSDCLNEEDIKLIHRESKADPLWEIEMKYVGKPLCTGAVGLKDYVEYPRLDSQLAMIVYYLDQGALNEVSAGLLYHPHRCNQFVVDVSVDSDFGALAFWLEDNGFAALGGFQEATGGGFETVLVPPDQLGVLSEIPNVTMVSPYQAPHYAPGELRVPLNPYDPCLHK